ncbi:MAG: type II toxin-antitoxin system RelE/ParE family toxin [Flammeovirgaceae bacterium]|nr:type II toxin-antitoxin system RelE/ParE family toxin [Flammeovirgaceae bacterium]
MVKIIWTKRAFSQFERSIKYIREEQGLAYAKIVHEKILETIASLENFPELGPVENALLHKKKNYRYLIVWSYKIIYRSDTDKVVIARIFHTSRNPSRLKGV